MKHINLLKNKKGFTLVELIVTLAIMSIILLVAGNYLFFGNRIFSESEVKNTEKSIGDDIYNFMQERLTYATKIEINASNDNKAKYNNVFKQEVGNLYFGKKNVNSLENIYGDVYYRDYKINYKVSALASNEKPDIYDRLKLSVEVIDKNNAVVYQTGSIIKCLNLQNQKKSIEIKGGIYNMENDFVNPIISYEENISDDEIFLPTELWDQMDYTYKHLTAFLKTQEIADLPEGWFEYWKIKNKYTGSDEEIKKKVMSFTTNNTRNDTMREYIVNCFWKGEWPVLPAFSDEILEKNPELKSFVGSSNGKIVYQVYIDLTLTSSNAYGDGSIYVFVNSQKSSAQNWNGRMYYNHDNGKWYVGKKDIMCANHPWDYQKAKEKWEKESQIDEKLLKYTINPGIWDIIQERISGPGWNKWFEIQK